MSLSEKDKRNLGLTILRLTEGLITEAEFMELQKQVKEDPSVRGFYCTYISTCSSLQKLDISYCADQEEKGNENLFDESFWMELQKAERQSPSIEMPEPITECDVVKVPVEQAPYKPGRLSRLAFKFSIAAMFFFILAINYFPMNQKVQVATLTETMDAEWGDSFLSYHEDMRLTNMDPTAKLLSGFAQITFDNAAEITIEGPAEYQITGANEIVLYKGRLYASVPETAHGFTVISNGTKVIDMGTEFGIEAGDDGQGQVQVSKGQVQFHNLQAKKHVQTVLTEREAWEWQDYGQNVKKTDYRPSYYARDIDVENGIVWREKPISLADIVGGGNGYGTGKLGFGIDPNSGTIYEFEEGPWTAKAEKGYNLVKDNPFIDGVFVPYDTEGPTAISSENHYFKLVVPTDQYYWKGIFNGACAIDKAPIMEEQHLILEGVEFGTVENPAIFIHATQGITFDLQAIRESFGTFPIELTNFTAIAGISDSSYVHYNDYIKDSMGNVVYPDTCYYVIVDGHVRYNINNLSLNEGTVDIDVTLFPEDRFLTLIASQGEDYKNIHFDWSMFARPMIHVKKTVQYSK